MQSFDFKKLWPHALIILGFAVLAMFYSYPALQGKVLQAHDNISWKAMTQEARNWHETTGENTLWTNSMFGGMPTYTMYMPVSSSYIYYIQSAIAAILVKPAYFLFLAMLSFYILSRVLHIQRWLGVAGAIAFAFSTYNPVIISAGHDTKMLAIAYMPAVLAGFLLMYRSKYWSGAALLGISLALMIASSHYQVVYYMMIVLVFAGIGILVIRARQGRLPQFFVATGLTLLVGILALGPSMRDIMTTVMEYSQETMRGGQSELTINKSEVKTGGGLDKDYAFRWSNGIGETFCLLVPQLYGGSSGERVGAGSNSYEALVNMGVPDEQAEMFSNQLPTYWGPQSFLSGPVYFGAIICFLFVLGLMVIRSPHKWWIAAACLLGIIMSWGHHFKGFNYLLFDVLPGLNKFRTPSMVLVIPQFLFPVIGVWALNDILKGKIEGPALWKQVRNAAIITGGLALLLGLAGSLFFDYRSQYEVTANGQTFTTDDQNEQRFGQMLGSPENGRKLMQAIREDRASMATKSGLRSALFIALAAGLIWAYNRKKLAANTMVYGIAILIAIDLIPVAWRYLNEENYMEETDYEANFEPRPVDQQILSDPDPYYRVLDLSRDIFNDAIQSYFHKTIGGYHPAKLEIYQDLIDVHMSRGFNSEVLNMLNTRYVIVPNGGPGGGPAVFPNPAALGNGWFVDEVQWAKTADEEILAMNAPLLGDTSRSAGSWNARRTAIIRSSFQQSLGNAPIAKDSAAYVRLAPNGYGLNNITYESANSREGLAVFSDIYYPHGWKAFIDGKEVPILKANYVLRALRVPAGNHKIEFKFHPQSFYTGNTIALISSLLLYALLGAALFMWYRRQKGGHKLDVDHLDL